MGINYSKAFLDEHRDINTGWSSDWYDTVYEDFKEKMIEEYGIEVEKMYFSGFWSQGDGACFEGYVENWERFLAKCGYEDPILLWHAKEWFKFSCKHRGFYYHSNSVDFTTDLPVPEHDEDQQFIYVYTNFDPDDLRASAALVVLNQYEEYKLYDEFKSMFQKQMDELYDMLEAEYEYLTSDEAVAETLDANGIEEPTEEEQQLPHPLTN